MRLSHFQTSPLALAAIAVILSGCVAQTVKEAGLRKPIEIPTGVEATPVYLKKVVVKLSRGHELGEWKAGLLCIPHGKLRWRSGSRVNVTSDDLTDVFQEELQKAGYEVVGDTDALFEDTSISKAEYLVGGLIQDVESNVCYPNIGFGDFDSATAASYVKVNWQVYSVLNRRVVHETTTEGSFSVDEVTSGAADDALLNAFGVATTNLLSDRSFHDLVTRRSTQEGDLKFVPISYQSARPATTPLTEHMNDARAAVVTIFSGQGHGSGFFVDKSGLVITNEHVVKEAKFVKVRLTTGREILGEVVRKVEARDVALVRVEEGGMPVLPVRASLNFHGAEFG